MSDKRKIFWYCIFSGALLILAGKVFMSDFGFFGGFITGVCSAFCAYCGLIVLLMNKNK